MAFLLGYFAFCIWWFFSGCTSVNQMEELASKDVLLKLLFKPYRLAQYTLSRCFAMSFAWRTFGKKCVARLQEHEDTALQDGGVINLDDTHIAHPYAKKLLCLCWLFDSSTKMYTWCMNLVVLQAVRDNGLEYPLFYSIWRKTDENEVGLTRYDLAKQMLLMLRESVSCRLWVAMDRWYLKKNFCVFLQNRQFDWVTKAKRNTALYRKVITLGQTRHEPVSPRQLIKQVYKQLCKGSHLSAIAIPNIYMKLPYETINRKWKSVTKERFIPIAAVAAIRLKAVTSDALEDLHKEEEPASYKGAYLIISNSYDFPKEALAVYGKRWRIETFFRTAKQELGLEQSQAHQHAHIELLFAAETLISYALWEISKEKTSDEGCTHGEMVRGIFHTRCQVRISNHKDSERIYIDFDTSVRRFAAFILTCWPPELPMTW